MLMFLLGCAIGAVLVLGVAWLLIVTTTTFH